MVAGLFLRRPARTLSQPPILVCVALVREAGVMCHNGSGENTGTRGTIRMIVTLADGSEITDEKTRANAHPGGDTPWQRPDYETKLADYTQGLVSDAERARFIEAVDGMEKLSGEALASVNLVVDVGKLETPETRGIY